MKDTNKDVVGDKCVRDQNGNLALSDSDKLKVWQKHFETLLNVEFEWDATSLTDTPTTEGPPPYINEEMVKKAIKKMKPGKAAGPSGIVAEMIKASGECIVTAICNLVNDIIKEESIPNDWNLSHIITCYKGKGDATVCGNYRGLKLLDQVMKVVEHLLEDIIRKQVTIDDMQFGFMPGRGTSDAIFILRQMQEKYLGKKKSLYFAFVDLEKAFDRVPRSVLWWSMRKLGVEEWVIKTVKAMYVDARSDVRVNDKHSESFPVTVGVHQGSVLSPLLFAIVMEALSRECRTGCPWELLYADDLVIISDSIEDLKEKLAVWRTTLESKGLRVNVGKTKVMHSNTNSNPSVPIPCKWPCGVCFSGVGSNSIFCESCKHWIHKRCTNIKGKLKKDNTGYKCKRCRGELTSPTDMLKNLAIGQDEFEAVKSFRYLGDTISSTGGCVDAVTARIKAAWGAFRELLPILTNKAISLSIRGVVFKSCVRTVLTYGSETWAALAADIQRIVTADRGMVRWICGVKLEQRIPTAELTRRLNINNIEDVIRWNRLRLKGHLIRMDHHQWPKKVLEVEAPGTRPKGRPRLRWNDVIKADMKLLGISEADALNRTDWRNRIRPKNNH